MKSYYTIKDIATMNNLTTGKASYLIGAFKVECSNRKGSKVRIAEKDLGRFILALELFKRTKLHASEIGKLTDKEMIKRQ